MISAVTYGTPCSKLHLSPSSSKFESSAHCHYLLSLLNLSICKLPTLVRSFILPCKLGEPELETSYTIAGIANVLGLFFFNPTAMSTQCCSEFLRLLFSFDSIHSVFGILQVLYSLSSDGDSRLFIQLIIHPPHDCFAATLKII